MTSGRWLGVAAPGLPRDLTALNQVSAAVGQRPAVANWYESWSWKREFPVADAEAIRVSGSVPQVTWEPWDPAGGSRQPKYRLRDIAAGSLDPYIALWAQGVAAWGQPLRIRFAHEMNYGGYPWCVGRNETTAADHTAAWLHVRQLFADAGATNARWVWCAQNVFPGTTPLAALYPGDVAVDEVAVDGYNPVPWGSPWTSFEGVFRRSISELAPLTARPISIGETGCPESGGDKAAWLRDMWATLANWPQVRGLLWFNFTKEADWRIDSSPAAITAFRAGLPAFL